MSYMYRAIGTAAVGSRHPPAQCLSHTTRIISNAYSLTAAPLYHYYFQPVLSASQSAVGRQSSCRGVFNSFFPSFLTRRRALVLFARLVAPSFFPCPSVRASVRRRWENGSVQLAVTLVSFATSAGLLSFRTRH